MKKPSILAFLLLFCTAMGMQATDRKVTRITTKSDNGEGSEYYLYNAAGQLIWMQSSDKNIRDVYSYNATGQLTTKTTMSWIAYDKAYKDLNREDYQYDAEGKMIRKDLTRNLGTAYESLRSYVYTAYDQQGNATAWQFYNGSTLYYEYKATYTYNDKGQMTRNEVQEFDPDYPEDGYYAYETSEYSLKDNGDIDTETKTVYKSDGSVKSTTTLTYTYSDLDASYAPTGLQAKAEGSNTVLTWNAVTGATAYVVTYDMEHVTVEGTSFTAKNIAEGDHDFTVQAIVDGEEKNAATPVTTGSTDAGKLAAQDLKAGTPRISVEYNDEGDKRTFYVIPLSWTLPEGHSEVKNVRVYYTSAIVGTTYTSTDSKDDNYELKIDEYDVRRRDAEGNYTCGADMEFYVTIIYGSGESEASNIVKLNPYNIINNLDTPDAIMAAGQASEKSSTESYNLAGQRVSKDAKGIVIRNGRKVAVKL